jgi:membrane protease YdiL (CAAX protease family)
VNTSEEIVPAAEPLNTFVTVKPDATADNPPWGLGLATLTWFLSVGLLLLVPPVFSLPYLLYRYRDAGSPTREILLSDKNFIFFNILGVIPVHVLTFALVWAVATRFGRYPFWRVLGWSWSPRFGFWKSVGLAILLLAIGIAIISRFGGEPTDMEKIILSSRLNACTTAFLATATAPLVEELIYRGILYSALHRALGMGGAVVIVMGLFTLVHVPEYWPNFGALSAILLLSFALTLVRARTGRLLPCYVIHLVFNGVQSLMIVFAPYLPDVDKMLQRRATGAVLIRLCAFHL